MALDGGGRIAPARVAWRRYGPEPAQARAVVLLLHGISGSQQALAPVSGEVHPDAGWASGWLGPGAALDTRHTCVLAPNALARVLAAARRMRNCPPRFPTSPSPTACACRLWLRALGVARLDAVVGYSYGGYQAFQWALDPPVPLGGRWRWRPARRRQLERRDRVAAPGRRAAGRRCLAQEQWVAARRDALMRYGRGLWLADAGAPEPGRRWTPRRAPGRRAFRPGRWPPCGRQPAAMTSATRSRPCARRCTGCAARRTCCFRPAMKPPCRPACIP